MWKYYTEYQKTKSLKRTPRICNNMVARAIFSLLIYLACTQQSVSQDIEMVQRAPFEPVLLGLVDFNDLNASPFPGTFYDARIPFRGLIAHTHFVGQIPVLSNNAFGTFSANVGQPRSRLTEARKRSRYSRLALISSSQRAEDVILSTRVSVPSINLRDEGAGFGTIALKLSDRQYALGFELRPVVAMPEAAPVVSVQFFGIEGQRIGAPVVLTVFGTYTFATSTRDYDIARLELTNMGPEPIGIDDVVFELPLIIGQAQLRGAQPMELKPHALYR